MNRSIFIIIVDFLLLNLIFFARFDEDERGNRPSTASNGSGQVRRQQDMVDVLRVTLDQERQQRDQLSETLRSRDEQLSERESRIQAAQDTLQRKTQEAQRLAAERASLETQVVLTRTNLTQLQAQMSALSNDARQAKQRLSTMETDLERRQRELAQAKAEAQLSKERLAEMEKSLQTQAQEFEQARHQAAVATGVLGALQNDVVEMRENLAGSEAEKQLLATQLKVAETEKNLVRELVDHERKEKSALLDHTAKLSEGVSALAQKTDQLTTTVADSSERLTRAVTNQTSRLAAQNEALTRVVTNQTSRLAAQNEALTRKVDDSSALLAGKTDELDKKLSKKADVIDTKTDTIVKNTEALREEMKVARPLSPNHLYSDYVSNRVVSSVFADRQGLLGQVEREVLGNSVLVSDGTNIFALLHVDDTPLNFTIPGTDWERLLVTLRREIRVVPGEEIRFLLIDPRVILVPVNAAMVRSLGVKVYPIAPDPSQFQEAILVGAKDRQGYGECKFQFEPRNPQYLRMDRNFFRRLSGTYAPGRGDMVFSKGGQLIGIMVNKSYCAVLNRFTPMFSLRAGLSQAPQPTAKVLAAMQMFLERLPLDLQ